MLLWSGQPDDPSFADDLIRMSDRNPNSFGVKQISQKGIDRIEVGAGVVMLGTPSSGDIMLLMAARPAFVILITSAAGLKGSWADVILPKSTHFEQDGTFLAGDGTAHSFSRAIECASGATPAWKSLGRLARALGKNWDLDSADACRRWGGIKP
jgi:NADH dehydrogenase/NADH:ubiquinone oxidoreductase subunit G